MPSESLLTPPPSSPEPFDSPRLAFQNLPSFNGITQTEHEQCEWCLGPDICIRTGESEKVDEGKVLFWSTLPGGRAISLAAVHRAISGNPEEPYEALDTKQKIKKMDRDEGNSLKWEARRGTERKEDQESEERRKYILRIQEEFGAWEDEKRPQMEDEIPMMERRERKSKRKRMEAPLRGKVKEMKKRSKKGGAKW